MNDFHNSRKPNGSGCIVFFNRSSCRLQRALLPHRGKRALLPDRLRAASFLLSP